MKCPRCNADNPDSARYCEDCGARLELSCPNCSQPVSLGKRFCRSCGAGLTTEERRAPAPQRYTPKHLAAKILTSRSALEGERKQVTVLFADLKGSLEILADRDPEEARQVLDPVLQVMMEAVHRYEGTVNQVMGDGIMALFGAPLAHEDHAVRACYAALAMQSSMRRLSADLRRLHGIEMQIRVGINSGEVIVRAIGSDLHMDYSAIGQTTHLAARMEQLAPAGAIRLTADTLRRAEGFVHVTPLGPTPVKGLTEPIEVYELMSAAAARTRLQAAAARGLTRFVGRDEELEQLRKSLDQARAGHGQVVAVVGEPGVGKSRLIYEVVHSHRADGWLILECTAVSYGKGTAYLPVVELLKSYVKVETHDGERVVREKVAGKVLTLDKSLEDTIPAVLALLDALPEDDPFRKLEPPQRRVRTLDAVKRLMLRESQAQPLLLLVEDLHWIDSETQAVLDSLVHSLPTSALLLIVSYRPEYRHAWGGKTYYRQLRVDPLLPDTADALLEAVLGEGAGLRPLKRLLIATPDIFDVHNAHFLWLIHLFQLGDWPTAMSFLQRGEEIARRLPEGADLVHLALMKGSIGLSHLFKRRTQAYLDMLAESLEAAERAGSHIYTTISHYLLGQGHFLAGDPTSAITHFETTLGIAEQTRNLFLPGALLWTAETQARLGRPAEAIDTLQRYQTVIDTVGSLEGLAWFPSRGVCHRVYGLVFTEAGELARAAQEFDRSLALLTADGYRPDLARTLLAFGELRRRQGRPAEAQELFTRAASQFRDMEFTFEMEHALGLLNL